jgi:transposase InsO family protein
MSRAGLRRIPGERGGYSTCCEPVKRAGLVTRGCVRAAPTQLWVTYVTEHRTKEGKIYCAVVIDTFSRKVGG